ncbi:hypothetical protein OPKNFCMD_4563 [Methylobacterium crusticola]|uniref:SGNH/GDSL hydrolase family protein n=2 Tax=Methylobacterium crusticola TaxID=1697972 RepID=A0ABQ4R3S5_9HYPH|nr:hypothetical protein OPKNFCMD_4563 [Methylobacterium crusticola]
MMFRFGPGRAARRPGRLGPCGAALLAAAFLLSAGRAPAGPAGAGPECAAAAPLPDGMLLPVVGQHVARGRPVRVLAIGSSSTEGVGASSPARAYPRQLEGTLARAWRDAPVSVVNAGIGGETADQTLLRLEAALRQADKPDLVIWQVGTNDAVTGGDEARFRGLLEHGVALVRGAGIDLILLDQQFYPAIPDRARYERYVGLVASVAAAARVPVFSRYALMREWGRQDPTVLSGMLAQDGFHMGDRGYDCLAQALGQGIVRAAAPAPGAAGAVARARPQAEPGAPSLRRG